MSFPHNLFKRLDEERFLGFQVWEFAPKSLSRKYGRAFLRKVVLRHPWRTLKGIFEYRRFLKRGRREGGMTYLFWGREEDFLQETASGETVLVGLGFCQKPFECPSKRPNHSCLYLSMLDLDRGEEWPHPICRECKVAIIGKKALAAGANMHIMTSALDIAHDVMIPAPRGGEIQEGYPLSLSLLRPGHNPSSFLSVGSGVISSSTLGGIAVTINSGFWPMGGSRRR